MYKSLLAYKGYLKIYAHIKVVDLSEYTILDVKKVYYFPYKII